MQKTVVVNVVGLSPALLEHAPHVAALARDGQLVSIRPPLPAVTCTSQSTYLTGRPPASHGIVGNGWFDRVDNEVNFWKQSNALVAGEKIWDGLKRRDGSFTCANLFWWYAMYSGADVTVTPRPMYPADGRKLPDIWTDPPTLRRELQAKLGQFPLFKFWGPLADIESSRWITSAAIEVDKRHDATLTLIYLPHLDYPLQRLGPHHADIPTEVAKVDAEVGRLIDHFTSRGAKVIVLSEYGIEPATTPIHLNRVFRERGWLTVREELGRELPDVGASQAFAVADHQIAHIYLNRPGPTRQEVVDAVAAVPGVDRVLSGEAKAAAGLAHNRAGDLIAVADAGAWFTYYHWLDEARRPDYAPTVDIHRKPGYDPCELFLDPARPLIKARVAGRLLQKKLGFRALLDVIPTDATLVKGTHGRPDLPAADGPLLIASDADAVPGDTVEATQVRGIIERHVLG